MLGPKPLVVCGLVSALYAGTLGDLVRDWMSDPALSHGLLIPPAALLVAGARRAELFSHPPRREARGLALVAIGCAMYLAGKLAAEIFLARLSFLVLCAGLLWVYWGAVRLRVLALPLLLLGTAIPLPGLLYGSLTGPLQLFASAAATAIVQAFGVAVHREGNIIQLAHISLGVEEACNGLNALSALVVAALLLASLICSRLPARLALLALAPPLAVAVNVVRVAGTALLSDRNHEAAMGFYHLFSGWLVFLGGFAALYAAALVIHKTLD
ncbi:MAG: Transmembrane exosortase (Exosortase_EpsH) [Chloroflexi bacterium ADurb.Bin222]|nr:MAG: Transmembrane exosortase (Exosortase_EpsH) [Chloroflexi bacterium ADurb.Bin222]